MKTYTYRRNPEDDSKIADVDVVQKIVEESKKAVETYNEIQKMSRLEHELSALGSSCTNAGALKSFLMDAINDNIKKQVRHRAIVIDDNGFADILIDKNQTTNSAMIKCGYEPGILDLDKYKEFGIERFLLNCNHSQFDEIMQKAKALNLDIIPTGNFAAECQMIADGMELEAKITGNLKSFFIPHAYTTEQAFNLIAQRGVAAAEAAAKFGGALAVAVGIADVLSGNKSPKEAAKDALNSTADDVFYGTAGSMVMSTALGPVLTTSLTNVANGIAAVARTTAVGKELLVAGTAIANTTSAVSAAGTIFSIGGATATAVTEVSSLAAAGTYAMGMGGVSAGIISLGGGVASALGAITGGAAIATGLATTAGVAAMGAIGAATSAVFCPPVAIGLAAIKVWKWLKD